MSIGDCIQINENQFYSNSNLVLHYTNINCNNDIKNGKNLFYEGNSCQHFQSLKHENCQNPVEFSFNLISHTNKNSDDEPSQLHIKKENTFKSNSSDGALSEKLISTNCKSLPKDQGKSFATKSPDSKSIGSKLNDKTVHELFSNNESSGPISKKCKVCFDKAVNQNFGVLSCESCKAFFRRNAIRSSPLKCSNGTDLCSVTSSTRKQCPSCRLKKCLQVGMRSELIQIRKNNPKINLGKRKSNATPQEGTHTKWTNQSTNCSNSSGRLSQDNVEDNLKSNEIGLVSNMLSENSPLIPASLWINTTNYQYQINNHQNLWFPMNLDQQCNDSLNCNLLSANCITPINNQSFVQSFDPIKYDVQIPMIKIKTHHNIIQPIAVLPTTATSLYETHTNGDSVDSYDLKSKESKFTKDPLLASEMLSYSEVPNQSIYHYDLSNYNLSNNTPKPSIGNNNSPSAFYPFTMQSNIAASQSVYFNGVETTNLNSCLWEYSNHNSESSASNDHSNSFMSIDSGSETFFCNPTYPDSCNSSQKIYLSPDRFEILESNPCFTEIEGDEIIENEEYSEFILSDDLTKQIKSISENKLSSESFLIYDEQNFIIQIGKIWESTLSPSVIFPNPNNIQVHLDLGLSKLDCLNSIVNFSSNSNNHWKMSFFKLTTIFLRQIKLFLDKIIDILSSNSSMGKSLKSELADVIENPTNETLLLLIIPIIFSNLITRFPKLENDRFQSDKEAHNFPFSEHNSNLNHLDSLDNPTVYFSVSNRDPIDHTINLVNAHVNLTLLSTRFFELDNIRYSSLQYLDKYCSGLSNFLSPTPVFYGLYALLKIIITRTKEEYCDLNWNNSLLRRDSSPNISSGTLSKLIYDLKSVFVTACDIVQTDTVEQRLNSLDQFLSWSKSQFDLQWLDFFNTIRNEQSTIDDYQFI